MLLAAALLAFIVSASTPIAARHEGQDPPTPAPAPAAGGGVKSLVVVTIDTVRADRLGCYGYFRDTSPRLDRFAAESLRFTRCLTPVAQTTPSHWSLFTGVTPHEHQVLTNFQGGGTRGGGVKGRKSVATLRLLAERMTERGFQTGGFVASAPTKSKTGLAAGFSTWTEPDEMRRLGHKVVEDAIKFVDGCADASYFAWLHLFDAHEPLKPPYLPSDYLDRYAEDDPLREWLRQREFPAAISVLAKRGISVAEVNNHYDSALRHLDDQLTRFLDHLDRSPARESTAVVIVADHGTAAGQRDHMGHGMCWDEQLRVPLLIRVPGVAPRVIDTPCSMLDLWPTVFGLVPALADADFAAQCRGGDVLAADHVERPVFSMGAKPNHDSLTTRRWKLMRDPEGLKLFDLEADPFEAKEVSADHPEITAKLKAALVSEVARHKKAGLLHQRAGASGTPDPKLVEELHALGYTEDDPSGGVVEDDG
jgi:arylsulfatase A-like enzyme